LLAPWFPALDFDGIRLMHCGPICWFVRAVLRKGAMTLGRSVYFGRHQYAPGTLRSTALLAHELVHVEQFSAYGRLRFAARYVWQLARAGFRYSRDLPYERDAYRVAAAVRDALRDEPPT
jgi:hypothetical protein